MPSKVNILDVMGDYTSLSTLLSVSRCSKLANRITKQHIDLKADNAQEMHQLVLDIFPEIQKLPAVENVDGAAYYRVLLETYFTGKARRSVEISFCVGEIMNILSYEPTDHFIAGFFSYELGSSVGRKKLLEAVEGWKHLGMTSFQFKRLQLVSSIARLDFSLTRRNTIGSSFCR